MSERMYNFHIFNSKEFAEFNRQKCDEIHYLDFDGISIIFGERDGIFYSPFSAPFGGFSSERKCPSLEAIEKAICNLTYKLKNKWCNITLPPYIYNGTFISQCVSALMRTGFVLDFADLNYSFDLEKPITMQHNAKNDWNIAVRKELKFYRAETPELLQTAYNIIKANREAHGYPPHLPLQEFIDTAKECKIPLDCFLVSVESGINGGDYDCPPISPAGGINGGGFCEFDKNLQKTGGAIASALVFTIAPKRALVVGWGDNRAFAEFRAMNFLAISMANYYKSQGYLSLDLGPSTKNGVPNYGLCHFKSSLGCEVSLKCSLSIR
ncbi:hypothetical protein AGMMS49938_11950 [Fibrobacterales bacterium]|nr:hypothetical protein AGMMS49938_11950 [Fibrobacterales bacterium]